MVDDGTIFQINTKYEALAPIMNEKIRRYWAASEAMEARQNNLVNLVITTIMASW
jgi:hypothetical protein